MSTRVWDSFLTEADKQHLASSRPKADYGFGRRAAVLAIDNFRAALGDEKKPLSQAIKEWPGSTGPSGWEAVENIKRLFSTARERRIPVIHTTQAKPEETGMPNWGSLRKGYSAVPPTSPEARDRYARRYDIVEEACALPGEVVIKKSAPSAFFGTPLAAHLLEEGIDTLIVCGESASGCVRASVVDGCSYRLRMILAEECVYDRHEAARAINLFDMDQKYGDVLPLSRVLDWMNST
jgi:maleamate amidohydrolase